MSAFEAVLAGLFHAHAHELHAFARRRAGRQEAEDIVQDTSLRLLQRGAAATLEHPRANLFRIAAHLAVDLARKTKIRSRYACENVELDHLSGNTGSPEAASEGAWELRRLQAALAELPPLCRAAFLLNRIDGLTYAEIAERLGLSVRTIDRYMVRAWIHVRGQTGRGLDC
ncbi:MAG: RNA polymerase sigma factor [Methylocella sp.]